MMAVPTYLLFELSLLVSSVVLRSQEQKIAEAIEETVYEEESRNEEKDYFFPPEDNSETDPEDYVEDYRRSRKTKRRIRYISKR
jgi:hypothetical protein